jgi:ABC-type multidrug transport system ATPase subunit
VLFDEPINGLDPDGILWIRNLMKSLAAQGRDQLLVISVIDLDRRLDGASGNAGMTMKNRR